MKQMVQEIGERFGYRLSKNQIGMVRMERPGSWKFGMFRWSNPVHADKVGIPRSYYVIDIGGARWRVPDVVWPAAPRDQKIRPRREIVDEIIRVFGPLLRADGEHEFRLRMSQIKDPRYDMSRDADGRSIIGRPRASAHEETQPWTSPF